MFSGLGTACVYRWDTYPDAKFSNCIEGHVHSSAWITRINMEKKLEIMKKDAVQTPSLHMTLGDIYSYFKGHTDGVNMDYSKAYDAYKSGYEATSLDIYLIKMTMMNILKPKRTRTDMICAWTTLCVLRHNDLASVMVKQVIDGIPDKLKKYIKQHSSLPVFLVGAKLPNVVLIVQLCAKQLSDFLCENSNGTFEEEEDVFGYSSSEESEDDDSDESNSA